MSETVEQFLDRAADSVRLQKRLADAAPTLLEALEKVEANCQYHRTLDLTPNQIVEMLLTIVQPAIAAAKGGE